MKVRIFWRISYQEIKVGWHIMILNLRKHPKNTIITPPIVAKRSEVKEVKERPVNLCYRYSGTWKEFSTKNFCPKGPLSICNLTFWLCRSWNDEYGAYDLEVNATSFNMTMQSQTQVFAPKLPFLCFIFKSSNILLIARTWRELFLSVQAP